MGLPDFIGIGAPKAATTWLFECLSEHPQIFIPKAKELMFFDYLYDENKINEYESSFPHEEKFLVQGEISTNYLASKLAPKRIKKHNPNVKIFVCLRNPVDQVYSYYWHAYRQNVWLEDLQELSFEEAIQKYDDFFLQHSFYHRHLTKWFEYFHKSQIHIIIYDDVINNPLSVIQSLYRFLMVDSDFIPSSLSKKDNSVRQGGSPKNSLAGKIHGLIYKNMVIYIYNPLCKVFGYQNVANLKEIFKIRILMQMLFYKKGYPKMSLSSQNKLKTIFKDEINSLSCLIDRDLTHWLK